MKDKNFLIVGGSSGIGLELVRQLRSSGANVWVVSRTKNQLPQDEGIIHMSADVTEEGFSLDSLPEHLDGLAYCPGSINLKPFRGLKPEHFRQDYEINVLGAVKVLQATQKVLRKAEQASVVMFSTVAVGQGMSFHSSIAAAKGAVEGLTRSLAAEWAPKVRVNCIAPSLTDTHLAARLLSSDEKREASNNRHPLKRVGEASEIASLAHFLLSEKSSWMTGQVIGLDGGLSTLRV